MNYLYLLSKLLFANISNYICTCLIFFNENWGLVKWGLFRWNKKHFEGLSFGEK